MGPPSRPPSPPRLSYVSTLSCSHYEREPRPIQLRRQSTTNVPRDRDPPFFLPLLALITYFLGVPEHTRRLPSFNSDPPACRRTALFSLRRLPFLSVFFRRRVPSESPPSIRLASPTTQRQQNLVATSGKSAFKHDTYGSGYTATQHVSLLPCKLWLESGSVFFSHQLLDSQKKRTRESFPRQSRGTCRSGPIFYFFIFFLATTCVPTTSSRKPPGQQQSLIPRTFFLKKKRDTNFSFPPPPTRQSEGRIELNR